MLRQLRTCRRAVALSLLLPYLVVACGEGGRAATLPTDPGEALGIRVRDASGAMVTLHDGATPIAARLIDTESLDAEARAAVATLDGARAVADTGVIARIAGWMKAVRAGGPRTLEFITTREGSGERVGVVIGADERGRITTMVATDPRGTSTIRMNWGPSALETISTQRVENGLVVVDANQVASPSLASSAMAMAEDAGGDEASCASAVATFLGVLLIHEGAAAVASVVLMGLAPGAAPLIMYTVIVMYLGTGGILGMAAQRVYDACRLKNVSA